METPQTELQNIDRETSPSQLTPEYAARILFLSFKYSQGRFPLQAQLFRYVHMLHTDWKIPDEDFELQVTLLAEHLAIEFIVPDGEDINLDDPPRPLGNHQALSQIDVMDGVAGQRDVMSDIFNSLEPAVDDMVNRRPDKVTRRELVEDIAVQILVRDQEKLVDGNGRLRKNPDVTRPSKDPWSSHFIEYGLRGNKTGLKEFDTLFADIRIIVGQGKVDESKNNVWKNGILPKLNKVIPVYNEHHPENPVTI